MNSRRFINLKLREREKKTGENGMKLVSWVMGTYNGIRRNVILEYELKALSAQNV